MGRVFLGFGFAIAAGAAAERAEASAWIAPESQNIATAAGGQRGGVLVVESAAYWEQPLSGEASLTAAPWFEHDAALEDGWRGEAVIGLKRAVFRGESAVASVQAGALWRSDPPRGCGEGGVEFRGLGGRALGQNGFANIEAAGRALEGGCAGARAELTLGYRPDERWLALGQVFADAPGGGRETVSFQLSVVRFDAAGRGIQFGVRTRLDDEGATPALVIGFWRGG